MTQLTPTDDAPRAACPVSALGGAYRPFEHAGMYEFFARARAEEPVFFCPEINYWVVTRRADVLAILRDPLRYSAAITLAPVHPLPPRVLALLQSEGYGAEPTQVSCDPPKHTRIREFASALLNPKAFKSLEPRVAAVIQAACDALEGRDRADLVADFAYELPARVIFLVLGIPDADTPKIKKWADNRLLFTFGELGEEAQLAAASQMIDYWRYCVDLVADRERHPRDDYASQLLALRGGDDARLTGNEIASLVFGLLLAGHETTTNLIANALHALLRHREQWQLLCADPSLTGGAVEECLRFASSVVCWRRRALVDVEIAGVQIPAGSNVLIALASANRDETQFEQPERFDIRRAQARNHLSFGNGIHFCQGAPLARMELAMVLREMTRRFPGMTLADESEPEMIRTLAFRGPQHLRVRLR